MEDLQTLATEFVKQVNKMEKPDLPEGNIQIMVSKGVGSRPHLESAVLRLQLLKRALGQPGKIVFVTFIFKVL